MTRTMAKSSTRPPSRVSRESAGTRRQTRATRVAEEYTIEIGFCTDLLMWKGEGHVGSAGWGARLAAARGDHHKLTAAGLVSRRGSVARRRQGGFPEQLAGSLIEGVKLAVVIGGGDEQQTSGSNHGSAVILAAGRSQAFLDEFGILAKRNLPGDFPAVQIDGVQGTPGRLDGGITIGIEEFVIAVNAVLLIDRPGAWLGRSDFAILAGKQISDYGVERVTRHLRECRHAAASLPDDGKDFRLAAPLGDSRERREFRRRTLQILAMAARAA